MTKRIKLTSPAIRTREEAEATMREITKVTIKRNELILQRDAAIAELNKRYETHFAEADQTLKERTELLRGWAEANPSEFAGLKSLDLTHGTIGWRTGQPTLKTLSGWTWDRVMDKLKVALMTAYVRTKDEVNKAQILADRELLGPEGLRDLGCRVIQEETFFVEPRVTETQNRQEATA